MPVRLCKEVYRISVYSLGADANAATAGCTLVGGVHVVEDSSSLFLGLASALSSKVWWFILSSLFSNVDSSTELEAVGLHEGSCAGVSCGLAWAYFLGSLFNSSGIGLGYDSLSNIDGWVLVEAGVLCLWERGEVSSSCSWSDAALADISWLSTTGDDDDGWDNDWIFIAGIVESVGSSLLTDGFIIVSLEEVLKAGGSVGGNKEESEDEGWFHVCRVL